MAIYCGLCASEDYTSVDHLEDGTEYYVCTNPFHATSRVWEPPTRSAIHLDRSGIGDELTIWGKLYDCVPEGPDFVPYGEVEDALAEKYPDALNALIRELATVGEILSTPRGATRRRSISELDLASWPAMDCWSRSRGRRPDRGPTTARTSGGGEGSETKKRGRVLLRLHKDGEPIHTLDDWFRLAPPEQGLVHWRNDRSAKETARLWLNGFPRDLQETLDGHSRTAGFRAVEASPEVETELDAFPRPRQHDMLVIGRTPNHPALLTVESKVDESFDQLIGPKLARAARNPYSNQPERVRRLTRALFGIDEIDEVADLRYQLFAATAGTLIEATDRGIRMCIFMVHLLITSLVDFSKVERNASDLDRFVSRLAQVETTVGANEIHGPISVPGGVGRIPEGAEIFIGKAVTDLRDEVDQPDGLKDSPIRIDKPLL